MAQGITQMFLASLPVLELLLCILRCHGKVQRMLSVLWRMRTLYYQLNMKVCTVHGYTFPIIANISETHKTLVRTALCCSPRLSHCGGGPAKHMAAQALLLAYIHIHTAIGACGGSTDIISSLLRLRLAATSPRGSPARHPTRRRGLQTDIVRVCSGLQIYGHISRA